MAEVVIVLVVIMLGVTAIGGIVERTIMGIVAVVIIASPRQELVEVVVDHRDCFLSSILPSIPSFISSHSVI